jgi:hypothetical protein
VNRLAPVVLACALGGCSPAAPPPAPADPARAYLDNSGRDDVLSGGVRMIPITMPKGTFVEQVRTALGLDRNTFYLLGQSWGGQLAIEYALKYQQHLTISTGS